VTQKKEISDIYGLLVNKRPPPLHKTGQVEIEKRKWLKDSFTREKDEDVL